MRRAAPQPVRDVHSSDSPRPAVAPGDRKEQHPASTPSYQTELYERGIKLMHSGKYAEARGLFEASAAGPANDMAHSARLHAQMCERRIAGADPQLLTADEHYDYAVALMNARKLAKAEKHLLEAVAQAPKADHIHYALALCRGLSGDLQSAYAHLKRAIEIQPRNRAAARNDPDFAEIGQLPPLADLL